MNHITIYQLDESQERGASLLFLGWERRQQLLASEYPNDKRKMVCLDDYAPVYETDTEARTLEEVFLDFNDAFAPQDFAGHSMSVSDLIHVHDDDLLKHGWYYCNTVGFRAVQVFRKEDEGNAES